LSQNHTSATTFEALRGRLFGLAYRMLGSRADAEDVVEETYVRWHGVAAGIVETPEAWLVTTAAPDHDLDLAGDLSIAFLTLLERLAPDERAAFLLHDVFDIGCADIAAVLEKSEVACRQVVHRARTRLEPAVGVIPAAGGQLSAGSHRGIGSRGCARDAVPMAGRARAGTGRAGVSSQSLSASSTFLASSSSCFFSLVSTGYLRSRLSSV
jgi:DNA-directed RNA polymerase specialized sigma24 family protein